MSTARTRHSATLLQDGRLLVAGGSRGFGSFGPITDTAEIFNPESGYWSPTGRMTATRYRHTAVLLTNGEVFVAGGMERSSTELYDTETGRWTAGPPLSAVRENHTSTLLLDGRVLICGGSGLNSVDIFSPTNGTISQGADMNRVRSGHASVLLTDGRVFVGGGSDDSSAEIYDPATNSWSSLMVAADPFGDEATATVLHNGDVFFSSSFQRAQVFDPDLGTWTSLIDTPLSHTHSGHTATLLPLGAVLLFGGPDYYADLYSPSTGWSFFYTGSHNPSGHTATLLPSGQIVVAGDNSNDPGPGGGSGYPRVTIMIPPESSGIITNAGDAPPYGTRPLKALISGRVFAYGGYESAEFDPLSLEWTPVPSPTCFSSPENLTLLPDGKLLLPGGTDTCPTQLYDPMTRTWSSTTTAPEYERSFGATLTLLSDGKVLFTGGYSIDDSPLVAAEIYDYKTGTWSATGSLHDFRYLHTSTLLKDGRVLIGGGKPAEVASTSEIYDPKTGLFTAGSPMRNGRFEHNAFLLPDGDVLLIGGNSPNGPTATVERFNVATGTWTTEPSLQGQRVGAAVVGLPDGRVFIIGGGLLRTSTEIYDPIIRRWLPGVSPGFFTAPAAAVMPDGRVLIVHGSTVVVDLQPTTAPVRPVIQELPVARRLSYMHAPECTDLRHGCDSGILLLGRDASLGGAEPNQPNTLGSTCADSAGGFFHVDESVDRIVVGTADGSNFAPGKTVAIEVTVWTSADFSSDTLEIFGAADVTSPSWSLVATIVPTKPGVNTLTANMTLPQGSRQAVRARFRRGGTAAPSGCQTAPVVDHDDLVFAVQGQPDSPLPIAISYGTPLSLATSRIVGLSEGSDGGQRNSSTQNPVFSLFSLHSGKRFAMVPDPEPAFSSGYKTLTFSKLPEGLDVGLYLLSASSSGVRSNSIFVSVGCSLQIVSPPQAVSVDIGGNATFGVVARGARSFQWQKDVTASGSWENIQGATASTYTTAPISGQDSGTLYRVLVTGNCTTEPSQPAAVTVDDEIDPLVSVVSPSGGEYWLLSTTGNPPNTKVVTWSMSDNVRICRVAVSLLYSDNGGSSYSPVPTAGVVPSEFGPGGSCTFPGELTTSLTYTVPTNFPSLRSGSLYKIQVVVTDQNGNETTVASDNPFYIVRANPDSVKTLILSNITRMVTRQGISTTDAGLLNGKLQELANHPRVQGVVVDVASVTAINSLYAIWDGEPSNTTKANDVLFGPNGIHSYLRTHLLAAYTGVKYIVLVGDDRVIPMARVQDRTILLPESTYPSAGNLTSMGTTVGQALAAGKYLTDDALAAMDLITTSELDGSLFLPDLAIGRLVETPTEIITTIATYIGQDGILDLSLMDPSTGHKVLVTGYDFLSNVSTQIRARWKSAFGVATADTSTTPVDGSLVGGDWGLGSVPLRTDALRARLTGRYGVMAISGHATHFEEGVPGTNPQDIQGLSTASIYGAEFCDTPPSTPLLDLSGSVIYAVGCHGGLSVPDSCPASAENSLDLPQAMLSRGAVVYVANSGYGWGLRFGIGYGARLTQIFTEQMTTGGTVNVGEVVRASKQRYFLETPRYDPYDEKSLMQWTLFGLPMYAVKTGIAQVTDASISLSSTDETIGAVRVKRRISLRKTSAGLRVAPTALPPSLTQLNLSFDFTGSGVYTKHDSAGTVLPASPGCPDANGCYYTLNGLVDRGSGSGDLPIQPYLIYDSRLSGSSQHGVVWKGGTYDEESGWKPVIAQLVSNGPDASNQGSAPRVMILRPTAPRLVPGVDSPVCRPSDVELNTLTIAAGEAVKNETADLTYSIARRYRTVDLEVFYFNNQTTPTDNCDRTGPALAVGPYGGNYHQVSGSTLSWGVPASDSAGVWRVVVVHNPNTVDGQSRGTWTPLDLTNDGTGTFRGSIALTGVTRLTYVVQAVDNRGNVTWFDYVSAQLPASGVPLGVPKIIDVGSSLTPPDGVVATATASTSVTITWNAVSGAASYDIYRSGSGASFVKINSSSTTNYTDTTVAANTAYLYAVKAIDASTMASALSGPDLATTVMFTDPTLIAGSTILKAAHITQLRTAVNAVRTLAGLGAHSFSDTITAGVTKAKTTHITELRTALNAARAGLALSPATYVDPTLAPASTIIKAAHVVDLRSAVR